MRPDIVKIDMSLVRGVDTDPVRQQVVASLASLAAGLGMVVVAEGVESAAELTKSSGCALLQGYGLAKAGAGVPRGSLGLSWRAEAGAP